MPKRPLSEVLAANVVDLMDNANPRVTQQEVADRSGGAFSQQHVGRIRKGQLSVGLDVLEGLAKAFDCEAWELLVDGGEEALQEAWKRITRRPQRPPASGNVLPLPKKRRRH